MAGAAAAERGHQLIRGGHLRLHFLPAAARQGLLTFLGSTSVRVQFNFSPRSGLTQAPHYQEAVPLPWLKDEKLLATPMPAEWGEDRLKEARTIMVKLATSLLDFLFFVLSVFNSVMIEFIINLMGIPDASDVERPA